VDGSRILCEKADVFQDLREFAQFMAGAGTVFGNYLILATEGILGYIRADWASVGLGNARLSLTEPTLFAGTHTFVSLPMVWLRPRAVLRQGLRRD
jgi:hypothetical protein